MARSILLLLLAVVLGSLLLPWRAECSVVLITASNYSLTFPDIEASFSPRIPAIGVIGRLIAAEPLNACQPLASIRNDDISEFLLSERGDCDFITKVKHAQDAGYVAAIVHDDEDNEELITMSGSRKGINIYAVFISKKAGEALRSSINETDSRCYLFPTFENTAKSLVAICFVCLLTVFAVFSTLFFVRRHHYRGVHLRVQEREARCMALKDVKMLRTCLYGGDGIEEFSASCAICLEDYERGERLRILPCGHEFHVPCIDQWLTTRRCFCPICKTDAHLKSSQESPSEHTPLLASCRPNFNTAGSLGMRSSQSPQFQPHIQQSCCSSSFPRYQEVEDSRQAALDTPESEPSSASCSQSEVAAARSQQVVILTNSNG